MSCRVWRGHTLSCTDKSTQRVSQQSLREQTPLQLGWQCTGGNAHPQCGAERLHGSVRSAPPVWQCTKCTRNTVSSVTSSPLKHKISTQSRLQCCVSSNGHCKVKHMLVCLQVKQVRVEYEYKLMLQPQQLNEQLREANAAKETAEQARDEQTAELNMLKAGAAEQQEQFLADMEAQHAVATEQLEAAYDTRFRVCLHYVHPVFSAALTDTVSCVRPEQQQQLCKAPLQHLLRMQRPY